MSEAARKKSLGELGELFAIKALVDRGYDRIRNLNDKSLVFDNNDHLIPFNPNLVCELEHIHDNHNDRSSRSYKLLGVLFDEHLPVSFNYHINYMKAKLSKALFCINRIKNFVPLKTLKTICFSLFHSHLLYTVLKHKVNCSSKKILKKYL